MLTRHAELPVARKLVYVEPSPEHLRGLTQAARPDAIDNSIAALITLPRYETVREDLERVVERNVRIERLKHVIQDIEAHLAAPESGAVPDQWLSGAQSAQQFGGGYVMIPEIQNEVVSEHHWLTHQEFADATALGQVTPGPVLISATFIGYRVAGTFGALVATISIFLPSFLMTIAAGSSLQRFRDNQIVQSFLRGVTPAVAGLLVAAAISIGRAGIHTVIGLLLAIAAGVVLVRFRPNALWVIIGAGALRFIVGSVLQ